MAGMRKTLPGLKASPYPLFLTRAPSAEMGGFSLPGVTTAIQTTPTQLDAAPPINLQTISTSSTPYTNQIAVTMATSTPANQIVTAPMSNTNKISGIEDSLPIGGDQLGRGMAIPPILNWRMENPATDRPVTIKVEDCADTREMYMNSAYEQRSTTDDTTSLALAQNRMNSAYEQRSSANDTTSLALAQNRMNSAYEQRSSADDTTSLALAQNRMNSAYEQRSSADDTTSLALAQNRMNSAYEQRSSADNYNINQALANHSSSSESQKCERFKSVCVVNKPYTCGGCKRLFTSICLLHEHIETHGLGGSYHYNNRTRTAFPKYDSVCCMNHTDRTCEISGNRPELANTSSSECIAESEEMASNEDSHQTTFLQVMSSDQSEKAERFADNSGSSNTSFVYVKTEKDNDSVEHTDLHEVGDSGMFGNRPEFQKSSNTGVNHIEKMTCVKPQQARTEDGMVTDKLPLKRKSESFYTSRSKNGCFKKLTLTKGNSSAKQTGFCSDNNTEFGYYEKTKNDSDQKPEISSDKKTEIGSDRKTRIDSDKQTGISSDKQTEVGSDKQTEVGSDRKPEIGSDKKKTGISSHRKMVWLRIDSNKKTEIDSDKKVIFNELHAEFQNCICFQCKLVFESEAVLKSHLEKHEGKFVCDCCSASFPSLTEFEKHVLYGEGKAIKAVDILYCSYCNMMFTEIKGLKAHICVSAEDLKWKRQAIRNSTGTINKNNEQKVLQYIPLHEEKTSKQLQSEETAIDSAKIECDVCSEEFKNDYFLIMHKTVHTHPYKCSKCSLCFISEFDRDQHSTSCLKVYSSMTCHTDVHRTLQDEKCNMCGAVFKSKGNRLKHEKRCPCLGEREKTISCDQHGSKFYTNSNLSEHTSTVPSDLRPFICEICGSTYKTIKVLNIHRRLHIEDKRYTCKTCGADFKQPGYLRRHSKIHQQSMQQCMYCGKTFHQPWNLKTHVRQHTGEKPYKCSLCGQGFTHNVSRKNHMSKCHQILN